MHKSKPLGLTITKKAKTFPGKTCAIFDSCSDDEPEKKIPKIPQKPLSKKIIEAEKCKDPSIYEYDEIFDDMKGQEKAKLAPKTTTSRYIDSLLKAAGKRKKNQERRFEKKVQVEREKEGDKYKDKESFVTSAYKKKMQEREEEEERERRENELMDVTLSGFYRHLFKSVGEEKVKKYA